MRFLYGILWFTLEYVLRVFYPRRKLINSPKEFYGRTIYVSNHAASFMDPLVIASFRRPIVFFMTRSDIFTPLMKPILWASHMLPIYRQQDGEDTKGKNEEVFNTCTKILNHGRNLLIFGEGFTDDVFIRRLKPVKKGAVRIGFITLEKINWKKNVYLAAVGCNYSDPNEMRSDLLISTSDKICLNEYREEYLANPNKVISEVTKRVEELLKAQLTHIEDAKLAPFHENVMKITRKGMNALCIDKSILLEERWRYSQNLAHWFNANVNEENTSLMELKNRLELYFKSLKTMKIDEPSLFDMVTKNGIRSKELAYLIVLFPFMILGFLHCALPYFLIKRFVEKKFRRRVFWSSVKLLLGMIIIGLVNIPFIFLFYHFVFPSYWLGFLYYLLIGAFGLAAYMWFRYFNRFQQKGKLKKMDLTPIWEERREILVQIQTLISVA